MSWSKYKHFRSTLHEDLHLMQFSWFIVSIKVLNSGRSHFLFLVPHARLQVFFIQKFCFSVLVLNSIKVKYSRFISGEQFQLLDSLSLRFWIEIEEVVSCL